MDIIKEIDYGIDNINEKDNEIKQITQIKEKKIKNYFYPDNILNIDDLLMKHNKIFIVSLKHDNFYNPYFNKKYINEDELENLIKSIDIIQVSSKIINKNFTKYLTIIDGYLFNKLNFFHTIESEVLLCCLLRFSSLNINRYIKQFDGISNINDLYNIFIMNDYFGQDNDFKYIIKNRIKIISNMIESDYYTNYNNCKLNITEMFNDRGFNLNSIDKLSDKYIQNIVKDLVEKNNDNDYLSLLFMNNKYIDAAAVNNNGFSLYKITNTTIINNDIFNNLFNRLSKNEKYFMIMNCLISKDLCHLIINNIYILNYIININEDYDEYTFISKYSQIFRYTLGYAWLTFYMEESIKRGYMTNSDRFIFNIETASLLPFYPYSIDDLHICPYLPILVNNEVINSKNNILGVEQIILSQFMNKKLNDIEIKELFRYGICNKDKFLERIILFTSGNKNINLFKNLNWDNIAISGSIMACCLPNFNSLMCNFIKLNNNDIDINFKDFMNEYYKDADIDIMCKISDMYEYIDKIYEFKNIIDINIRLNFNLNNNTEVSSLYSNKSCSIWINKKYIIKNIDIPYNEVIIKLNTLEIKKIIYQFYINWHINFLESELIKKDKFLNNKYHEIFIPVHIDNINIILINDDNKDIFSPKINYKYKISSVYILHSFELFQIKYDNFFSTVSKFHLPIVRSYYDGSDIFITPSCISACLTLINIDYKYFAGSKDPIEIINKYRMRGFGTILNNREIKRLIEYSNIIEKWKKLYNLDIKQINSVKSILGIMNINHNLFKPSMILYDNDDIYIDTYKNIFNITNIKNYTSKQIIDIINILYNHNSLNIIDNIEYYKTINNYGYVEPCKKWLIDAYF